MIDKTTILSTLDRLAAEHPGTYDNDMDTPHKRESGMNYSYDDCLIGCLIRQVDPELHADLLDYEATEGDSFQLSTTSNPETPRYELQERMRELFGDAYDTLSAGQSKQDGFQAEGCKPGDQPHPQRWEHIVAWVHTELEPEVAS